MPSHSFCPPRWPSFYDLHRLSSAGTRLSDLWQKIPEWPRVGNEGRVIVIGAGISGLCVAWGLRAAGFSPIILERTPRVGGRIFTSRGHFGAQYAELGATRIPANHPLPMAYIHHFGLPLVEYPSNDLRQLYSVLGQRFKNNYLGQANYPDDFGLTAEEARLDASSLHDDYTNKAVQLLSDPQHPQWPTPSDIEAFQGHGFLHCLDKFGASAVAKEICRAQAGTIVEVYDALAWLAAQRIDGEEQKLFAIQGGNDRLTTSFAESLGDSIVTNAHVRAVHSESRGVRVDYVHAGRPTSLSGDYVVCCVPHRLLLEIEFHPQLSAAKLNAVNAVPMGQVTRLNYQFSRRFWNLDEGLRGLQIAHTTSPIERIWDLTVVQPGPAGILVGYAEHEHAAAFDRLPSDEARLAKGLTEIDSLFPTAKDSFMKGLAFSWQQPWSKGAWAAFLAGQMQKYLADFQRAEQRIHFAGDYMSFHTAWIQGALESAHFAIAEVIAAHQKENGTL